MACIRADGIAELARNNAAMRPATQCTKACKHAAGNASRVHRATPSMLCGKLPASDRLLNRLCDKTLLSFTNFFLALAPTTDTKVATLAALHPPSVGRHVCSALAL
jgi:hypothetical protein